MSALFTIDHLTDQAGYWTATLTVAGEHVTVDRKYGSWQIEVDADTGLRRDVRPGVAARLQERVRSVERGRRREDVAA